MRGKACELDSNLKTQVRGWGGVGRGKLRRTSLVKIEVRKDRCELGGGRFNFQVTSDHLPILL